MLPSGDLVWVRIQVSEAESADGGGLGPQDVGLCDKASESVQKLSGFADAVRGVVTSVRQALAEHSPDSLEVEFGIEITARTGRVLSVLAEAGGTAQIRVTASWNGYA